MMDNSHETIGYDSNTNLDAGGILRGAQKLLDLEMLL
jgi:hypothetical protein